MQVKRSIEQVEPQLFIPIKKQKSHYEWEVLLGVIPFTLSEPFTTETSIITDYNILSLHMSRLKYSSFLRSIMVSIKRTFLLLLQISQIGRKWVWNCYQKEEKIWYHVESRMLPCRCCIFNNFLIWFCKYKSKVSHSIFNI